MRIDCMKILPCMAFAVVISLVIITSPPGAEASTSAPPLYSQLESFHGHVCAGSLFGARLGLAAKEALKEAGGTGKFTSTYYDLSCPVDGIQVSAGTTYGNKALTVQDRDEHRLILTASGNKLAVEARLTKKAEQMGLRSRELGKTATALPTDSPERLQLKREIEEIYKWLQTAPTTEVVVIVPVRKQ